MKHIKLFEEFVSEQSAYKSATNNELAQYIINLSNELKSAKSDGAIKEANFIAKDLEEVKAELSFREKNEMEKMIDEAKEFNVKDLPIGAILNFKDGETWKVTKVVGNSSNPRGYMAAPHGDTKKNYVSMAIEFKLSELEDGVVSVDESNNI